MIARIKRIRSFRGFRNWACNGETADFAAINVIYGFNGSGKSTLCSLLRDAGADADRSAGLELEVTEAGTRRSVISKSDPFWRYVKVFNRDYVEANLQFDEADPTAIPLLVLGEKRVEMEARRADLQASIREIEEKLLESRKRKTKADSDLSVLLKGTANTILAELQHLGGRYNPRSFNAASVRRRLTDGFDEPSAAANINDLLGVVREQQLDEVTVPSRSSVSIERLAGEVRSVLTSTAVSEVIDDLRDHPDWNRWAQEGLALHNDRDTCIYCTNAVPAERKQALGRHFDDSLRQLQGRIAATESELHEVRDSCAQIVAGLPADELVSSEFRLAFREARLAVGLQANGWNEVITTLLEALEQKRDSLFSVVQLPELPGPLTVDLDDVISLLWRHNEMVEKFDERRRTAAQRIELLHIATIRDQAEALSVDSAQLKAEQENLSEERERLQEDREALAGDELDPAPIARELNDDLGRLLGRSDLRFSLAEGGYRITRDGEPAHHLSEGERNAIALLYFLRSLGSHDTELEKCTVVIDDPVSSLDRNALTGLSAHLWVHLASERQCRQIILFSHSFELFRMWLGHCSRLSDRSHQIFEIRRQRETPASSWSFDLVSWRRDSLLEKHLRAEYHYLFWRVADAACVSQTSLTVELAIEAESALPTVSRRLLEMFLGFKAPASLGKVSKQMEKVGDATDSVTRERIIRFLGDHAHGTFTGSEATTDGAEGIAMLFVVLKFIHDVDPDHFVAMCEAVAVDLNDLVGAFPSTGAPHLVGATTTCSLTPEE